jgi:hypothetical protein
MGFLVLGTLPASLLCMESSESSDEPLQNIRRIKTSFVQASHSQDHQLKPRHENQTDLYNDSYSIDELDLLHLDQFLDGPKYEESVSLPDFLSNSLDRNAYFDALDECKYLLEKITELVTQSCSQINVFTSPIADYLYYQSCYKTNCENLITEMENKLNEVLQLRNNLQEICKGFPYSQHTELFNKAIDKYELFGEEHAGLVAFCEGL